MITSRRTDAAFPRAGRCSLLCAAAVIAAIAGAPSAALADDAKPAPEARIIVIGEGSVSAPPDYARITSGVTTRAKTAKEAGDADAKVMAGILASLQNSGVEQKDIQTSRFSVQPVYTAPGPNIEQRLTGFSVSNQVAITIRQIDKVGEILDRLVTAGATDAGHVEFLHSDPSKTLDRAREAAMADARRKAELYAHAAGLTLGGVAWITEDSSPALFAPKVALRAAAAAPVPIAAGEDTLQARITVGYDIAR
ncbi:MAG: SIMPL domain-containing protein [Xanthobacteraceae bacterium]